MNPDQALLMKITVLNSLLPLLLAASTATVSAAVPPPPTGLRVVPNFWTLPSDRGVPWAPGIPGGIPNYPNSVNVKDAPYNAVGDGVADDYSAIMNAIAHCPNGGAVYFPTGTYKFSQQIQIDSRSIVLRGDGYPATKLICTATSGIGGIFFRGSTTTTTNQVVAGYGKGSTLITVNSSAGFRAGDYIKIVQNMDTNVLLGNIPGGGTKELYQAQLMQITNISGNNISLSRPIYYDGYKPSLNLIIKKWNAISNCGVENLKFEMRGSVDANLYFLLAAHCWVKGVEGTNCNWYHVALDESFGCEVRSNYFHHSLTYGQGGYGVDVLERASDNLIEDNVFYYLRHAMICQNGANGNVFGYNYSHRLFDMYYPDTDFLLLDMEFHGGHPYMNLVEGNVLAHMGGDDYWGSSRHNTFFRNNVERYSTGVTKKIVFNVNAVQIDRLIYYYNVVGNVLCRPGDTGWVWKLGVDSNDDQSVAVKDQKVLDTLLRHGNFDYPSGTTQWDSTIANQNLPPSLYLKQKPAFFGTVAWPAFGPGADLYHALVSDLPAKLRYWNQLNTDEPASSR